MILLSTVALLLLTALGYVAITGNVRARSIFLAALAATPGATITVLALSSGGGNGPFEWLLSALFMAGVCFVGSLIVVLVLGTPISASLRKLGWNSCFAYVTAGACAPLAFFAIFDLYSWHFVDSGPFSFSLRDQVRSEGAARVIARNVVIACSFAASGAAAAYVFWLSLRSNKSLETARGE